MRVEPAGVGSILHIVQRGARGAEIVRDDDDRLRFTRSLCYLNDTHTDPLWHRATSQLPFLERPRHWPEREPLVNMLGWTLLNNHFHLLIQEIVENGTSRFMWRLCGSLTMCFNRKYGEKGSIFQGSYKSRTVSEHQHLNYLAFYVLIKNTVEMYPGGLRAAQADFPLAWEWARQYRFSSLRDQLDGRPSPILHDPDGLIGEILGRGDAYADEARGLLAYHMQARGGDYAAAMLEDW